MLIAEDLLLLLTDDDTGRLKGPGDQVDVALGGALLVELALTGRVDIAGPDERVREGRLVVRDAGPTGDPLLDEALAAVGRREGKKPQGIVAALGKGTRARLYERLVGAGALRAEKGTVLGIFPRHRWPAQNAGEESVARAGLETTLRSGEATDARAGALVSLLLALNVLHKVVDPESVGLTKRQMNTTAKRIAQGEWAGKAVRSAIDSMNAAIAAAVTTVVVIGASTGS